MAINRDFIGRTYEFETPYQVGREKVREFATAIGDQNPLYHNVEAAQAAGHRDLIRGSSNVELRRRRVLCQ